MNPVDDIKAKYAAARSDHERIQAIFYSEEHASGELVDFLLEIAAAPKVYDLTRIEACKCLGQCGHRLASQAPRVVAALLGLAEADHDTDVQNYALMSLEFHGALIPPSRMAGLIAPDRDENVRYAALSILERQLPHPEAARILHGLVDDPELGRHIERILGERTPREAGLGGSHGKHLEPQSAAGGHNMNKRIVGADPAAKKRASAATPPKDPPKPAAPGRGAPPATRLRALGFSAVTARFLLKHGPRKLASDFVLPSPSRIVSDNTRIPNIPPDWLAFAESGSGDLWLVDRATQKQVAFWNHDRESRAKADPLGIDLVQWLELAEYMREYGKRWRRNEHAGARRDFAREAREFLRSLSPLLAKRYPYKLG